MRAGRGGGIGSVVLCKTVTCFKTKPCFVKMVQCSIHKGRCSCLNVGHIFMFGIVDVHKRSHTHALNWQSVHIWGPLAGFAVLCRAG